MLNAPDRAPVAASTPACRVSSVGWKRVKAALLREAGGLSKKDDARRVPTEVYWPVKVRLPVSRLSGKW